MIKIIKVTGNSLSPFFLPGDFVLIWQSPSRFKKYSPGDFVVVKHSDFGTLIKRVKYNDPDDQYLELEGIHPDSLTPQKMGRVSYDNIIGRVIRRFSSQGDS